MRLLLNLLFEVNGQMTNKFMTCPRCGIPFTLTGKTLSKRKQRNIKNLNNCRDCMPRPEQIDLNAVWEYYAKTKGIVQ
jgi:hypothetical protein